MYTFDSVVRYSEIDSGEKLSLQGIVNYFQDCSNFQSEALNLGFERLKKLNRGWVLSYWQIKITDRPKMGTKIKISTWAHNFERFMGSRNFMIKDENQNDIAAANSVWICIDGTSLKPVVPEESMISEYGCEPAYEDMKYEPRKIMLQKELKKEASFSVRKSDLDTNCHVNNAQYIRFALEYLPEDFEVGQIRAEYKISALHKDEMCPYVSDIYKDEDDCDRIQVVLKNNQDKIFAVVEFKGR